MAISGSEFKFAQLAERGWRASVELQRFFQELARVTRSIVVTGQHRVVQQVLRLRFCLGIRQILGAGRSCSCGVRALPSTSPFRPHGLCFGRVGRVALLQLPRIGLQVVEFGPGSFDPAGVFESTRRARARAQRRGSSVSPERDCERLWAPAVCFVFLIGGEAAIHRSVLPVHDSNRGKEVGRMSVLRTWHRRAPRSAAAAV